MSTNDAPSDARRKHERLGRIEGGVTQALFVATGVGAGQIPIVMVVAVLWPVITLALPLFWRGVFTFALARSRAPDESVEPDPPEPITLVSLGLMAFVLGLLSCFALWGSSLPVLLVVLAVAAALGSVLFATIYVIDPPIRTLPQMALLAFECLLWGIGACVAAVRFIAP